jgi:salicylate hydroxylase
LTILDIHTRPYTGCRIAFATSFAILAKIMDTVQVNGKRLRVGIIGGGLGGLSLAIGLQQHSHLDVHIYETKDKLAEVGAAVTILPSGLSALKSISPEVGKAIEKCLSGSISQTGTGKPPAIIAATGDRAGERLGYWNTRVNFMPENVLRAAFLSELANCLKPGTTHLSAKVVEVLDHSNEDGPVTVKFAKGENATFDVVIGADGVHSTVRKSLFDACSTYNQHDFTGGVVYRAVVPIEEAVTALGRSVAEHPTFLVGPGCVGYSYPTDLGKKVNMVCNTTGHKTWDNERWFLPGGYDEVERLLPEWEHDATKKWLKVSEFPLSFPTN